jgi:2-C-methyl-D-erythritol 4-phosphate cytidylyltransferase/2-C-methyl-D-erythritol 2,4-cyclodiphosphate synthase|tara:strand:- start:5181 stop:6320 length:1140 start_codon:yes stop_codon:yes gene_type:complete
MSLFLIILAAGDSKRLKSNTPKPFHIINNITLLEYSFDTFKNIREIKKTVIVYNKKHKKHLDKLRLKNILKVVGGKTRQESTFKALKKIKRMNCKKVIIHDAARPNPSKKLINKMISKLKKNDAVVPTIKVNDATKRAEKNIIFKNIQRNSLRFSQTPQGFTFKKIYEKHKKNINTIFDDDSALFTEDDEKVITINGSKSNLKITDSEDLNIFSNLKKRKTYSGIGFDIHKLVKGRKLYLGGIKVAYPLGLKGHSDADPVLHAIIDSLLGACGLGDIGKLFSDKNKKYKNIRSTTLLKKVVKLIKSINFSINNIDINIIAQKPKIKKYSKKMIQTISKLCEINSNQVNIKGKTTEKLGLVGQGEAIASEVISSVTKYDQ